MVRVNGARSVRNMRNHSDFNRHAGDAERDRSISHAACQDDDTHPAKADRMLTKKTGLKRKAKRRAARKKLPDWIPARFDARRDTIRLPLEIHEFLQHLVAGRDGPRIGLERALSDDHIDEFLAEIDIGLFDGPGQDFA